MKIFLRSIIDCFLLLIAVLLISGMALRFLKGIVSEKLDYLKRYFTGRKREEDYLVELSG